MLWSCLSYSYVEGCVYVWSCLCLFVCMLLTSHVQERRGNKHNPSESATPHKEVKVWSILRLIASAPCPYQPCASKYDVAVDRISAVTGATQSIWCTDQDQTWSWIDSLDSSWTGDWERDCVAWGSGVIMPMKLSKNVSNWFKQWLFCACFPPQHYTCFICQNIGYLIQMPYG